MSTNIAANNFISTLQRSTDLPENEVTDKNTILAKNNNVSTENEINIKIEFEVDREVLSKLKEKPVLNKPNLPNSEFTIDPDTANVLLMDAFDKQSNQDIKNTTNSLKVTLEFRSNVNAEKLKKFQEQIQKQKEEAAEKAKQQTMSDVMLGLSIFAAVAGVLASIFTFGAAAPAVAVALVGLGMTGIDAANRIVQATDGQYTDATGKTKNLDISISGLVRMSVEDSVYKLLPKDEKGNRITNPEIEKFINDQVLAITIAVNVMLAGAMITGGAGAGYIAKEAAKKAIESGVKAVNTLGNTIKAETAQIINTVATTTEVGTEIVEGAMGVSTSIYGIQIANITFEKNELSNQKVLLESYANFITEQIKSDQASLTIRIKDLSQMWETVSETNANYYQSQSKAINAV
jgi:hypothetical protein